MGEQSRLDYMDVAKGIAIIFVILGHYCLWLEAEYNFPKFINNIAFSFHVALFFIVSGYFMKPGKPYSLRRELKSLVLPYGMACLAMILLACVHEALTSEPGAWIAALTRWVIAAVYGAGDWAVPMPLDSIAPIGALWFLLALFWGRLFSYLVRKLPVSGVWVAVLFILGYLSGRLVWLPFSIQPGLCATLYVYVGQEFYKRDLLAKGKIPRWVWVVMFLVFLAMILTRERPGLATNLYKHIWFALPGEFCGALCVIGISKLITEYAKPLTRPLAFLGRNTLPIYCCHAIELNLLPVMAVYGLGERLGIPIWIMCFAWRGSVVAVMSALLYALPRPISGIFYRGRRKASV